MADDINLYVKEKLEEYIREKDQGQDLQELFQQDFGKYRSIFPNVTLRNKQKFIKHLRYSGIYIPLIGGGRIHEDVLIEILDRDSYYRWGDKEVDELIQVSNFCLSDVLSTALKEKVQHRLTKYQAYNRANRSTIENLDIPTQFTYTTLHSTSKIPKTLQKSPVQLTYNCELLTVAEKPPVQLALGAIVQPTYEKSPVQPTYECKLPTTPLPDVAKSKIPKTLKSELLTVAKKSPVQLTPITTSPVQHTHEKSPVQSTYKSEIPTVAEKFPVQPASIATVQLMYKSEILTVAEKSTVQPTPITPSPVQPTYEKSPVQLTYNCELPTVAEKPPVQLALGAIVQPTYDCELLTVAEKPPVQTTYEKSPVQLALGAIVQPTYEKCPVQPTYKSELPTIPLSNVSKSKPELTVQPTTITTVQPTYENSKALLAVKLLTTLVSKLYKVQYTLEVGQGILACEYVTYALPEDYG